MSAPWLSGQPLATNLALSAQLGNTSFSDQPGSAVDNTKSWLLACKCLSSRSAAHPEPACQIPILPGRAGVRKYDLRLFPIHVGVRE